MKCRPILLLCLLSPILLGAKAATPPPAQTEPAAATTEAPPVLKAPPIREETRRSKVLEEQLKRVDKETEILWLGEGDSQFLGLFLADHSGATFANALILHDNLQHPDWPGVVHELRTALAAHGWNTLSIAMPDYRLLPQLPADTAATVDPAAAPSPAASAPQNTAPADPTAIPVEEKSVEYLPEQVPDEVDRRARAGSELLRQKSPKPMVVIAIGLSAGFAAKKAQTMLIKDIAGLVIIDPVQPRDADFNTDLDAMDLRIPILDIAPEFFPRTDPVVRLHSAGRARQNQFEQRIVRGARPDFSTQENAVIKAVRGWGERWLRKKKR
ncbi:MAG: DUF3530 family protein [Gammaproteobacteria bacterium]|nr:DUF3530 family protein [Gammaproteobacteria bacterium]